MMRPTFWQRVDQLARNLTPFGITVLLVLVSMVPSHIPGFARVVPILSLAAVYHWAVSRPELLPSWVVFLIGLLQDLLSGTPMGISSLVFLTVYWVVVAQRRFLAGKSFAIMWVGFLVVTVGAGVETWVLISIFNGTLVTAEAAVYQYLLTISIYPVLAWALARWEQSVLTKE